MRIKILLPAICIAGFALAAVVPPPFWGQWGQDPQHAGNVSVAGQTGTNILADIVYDPFTQKEEQGPYATGSLLVHYQTPLIAGNDVFMECKTGQYANIKNWVVQTWCEQKFTWVNGVLTLQWTHISDWKPVPFSPDKDGPGWEPVYHAVLTKQAIWVPGFGGAVWKLSRDDGSVLAHVTPFGNTLDPNTYTVGPLSADGAGNVYYNVMQLDGTAKDPWVVDVPHSWLVKVTAAGTPTAVPWASLVPGAPAATDQCTFRYDNTQLPWPVIDASGAPVPAPTITCGTQRPALNTAPAIAPDGTIYDISRASLDDYYGYVVAINPDLTPKWIASMRGRFNDGCGTPTLPLNGAPGGCRAGLSAAFTGVSPPDGLPGTGRVLDDSTGAPLIAPDGSVYYGAYVRYDYAQGRLMHFSSTGQFLNSFQFGWDTTPAIYPYTAANGTSTFAVITKENHYGDVGSYCNDNVICPPDRTTTNPGYPEEYFLTSLTPDLQVNWRWRNTNTLSCSRNKDGSVSCVSDHPVGFEWCVNAPAVDANGTIFVNSEDGNLYVIDRNGNLLSKTFTNLAVGAAYTPLSIGPDGKIYTQNNGHLFVVGN